MSMVTKVLNPEQLGLLDIFLNGGFAPLQGYLKQDDHVNVLQNGRLADGALWPFAFSLPLSPSEKRDAQLAGRIALLDQDHRAIAEIKVEQLYRFPPTLVQSGPIDNQSWFVGGTITALNKILSPTFKTMRHNVQSLRDTFRQQGWRSIVAIQAAPELIQADMQQACEWLKATQGTDSIEGGLLIQVHLNSHAPDSHVQMRALRQQVRCSAAKQIKFSLLPHLQYASPERTLLLQALIARNYGATAFVVGAKQPRAVLRYVLQHRDELGMDIIPVRQKTQQRTPTIAMTASPLCQAA